MIKKPTADQFAIGAAFFGFFLLGIVVGVWLSNAENTRLWISALSGWAAAAVGLATIFVLIGQMKSLRHQTRVIIGDLEPDFYCKGGVFYRHSPTTRVGPSYFVIVNNNRRRMFLESITFESDTPFTLSMGERIPFDKKDGVVDACTPMGQPLECETEEINDCEVKVLFQPFYASIVGFVKQQDENVFNFSADIRERIADRPLHRLVATLRYTYAGAPDDVRINRHVIGLTLHGK